MPCSGSRTHPHGKWHQEGRWTIKVYNCERFCPWCCVSKINHTRLVEHFYEHKGKDPALRNVEIEEMGEWNASTTMDRSIQQHIKRQARASSASSTPQSPSVAAATNPKGVGNNLPTSGNSRTGSRIQPLHNNTSKKRLATRPRKSLAGISGSSLRVRAIRTRESSKTGMLYGSGGSSGVNSNRPLSHEEPETERQVKVSQNPSAGPAASPRSYVWGLKCAKRRNSPFTKLA